MFRIEMRLWHPNGIFMACMKGNCFLEIANFLPQPLQKQTEQYKFLIYLGQIYRVDDI